MVFEADGLLSLASDQGTWKAVDAKTLEINFDEFDEEYTMEFNEDATEATLIKPVKDPPSKMILQQNTQLQAQAND